MDMTRRPIRPSEWTAVLGAVYAAEPSDEQTWLEWKSTVDLRSKVAVATQVCKTIIAFANRDPVEASVAVGGIGILVIGVEPGAVPGVTQIDNADLDQLITNYVGSDGPAWQPHWTQFRGKTVLIIEVSQPQIGDPPHAFRKACDPISDGQVFVRKLARSVPPDHRDVKRLADRFASSPASEGLDVLVTVDYPFALSKYTWSEAARDAFVAAERERLILPLANERASRDKTSGPSVAASAARLAALEAVQNAMSATVSAAMAGLVQTVHETRDEEEYETEVAEYLARVTAAWPAVMRDVATQLVAPPIFQVRNLSQRNYRQVEVKLKVSGEADAAEQDEAASPSELLDAMPERPRLWGPYSKSLLMPGYLSDYAGFRTPVFPSGPTTEVERGGSFTLTFRPIDLRPGRTEVLERDWVVLVPASRGTPVVANWSATATNADGIAQGELDVVFEGETVNVYEALAHELLLGGSEERA